jgi:hypothetical protein
LNPTEMPATVVCCPSWVAWDAPPTDACCLGEE